MSETDLELSSPDPDDMAQLIKAIFEDDRRGARILDHLARKYMRPAVTTGGIDAVLMTYQRLGNREVIDYLIQQINRANRAD